MADNEQVDRLKSGVDEWNRWRDEHIDVSIELSRADLRKINLIGALLTEANLFRSNLIGAELFEADLSKANLFEADLRKADLSSANLCEG